MSESKVGIQRFFVLVTIAILGVYSESSALSAEEMPTSGMVYNTKEASSITYSCRNGGIDTLECQITQTSVRKKASMADLEKHVSKAVDQFRKEGKAGLDNEVCGQMGEMLEILDGRRKPPAGMEKLQVMSPTEKQDTREAIVALRGVCLKPSAANIRTLVSVSLQKDSRTCKVGSHSFDQTFVRVSDYSSNKQKWVVKTAPHGPCGIVNLSRFERAENNVAGLEFWNYVAKKIVTNPEGTILGLGSCSELDESEYLYDWKSSERFLGCDYIEFSVF